MLADELLVAGPGARAKRWLNGLEPCLEELLDGGALADERDVFLARPQRAGQLLSDLPPRPPVQVLAAALAVLPAEVHDGFPAPIGAMVDRAFPVAASSPGHAAASRRRRSTYSVTAATGMRRLAPMRTDSMAPARSSS